ncbi:MAG: SMC-Scp complex subunit ScpB [Dehalococcoidia bacterium]|nr:SMC-Scp complex subunit ScpB [Dehalococcoidia bacterium]
MTDEQERTPEDGTDGADGTDSTEVAAEQPGPTVEPQAELAPEPAGEPEPQATRMEPPRAFDDEAEPAPTEDDTTAEDAAESEPEPEVVAEGVEPDAAEAFEDLDQLPSLLEALLFVADHPIDVPYLSRAVDVSQARVERALDQLADALRDAGRGIRLQRGPAGVQLTSAPEAAAFVERFLGLEASRRLSTAALETLAIIAYRQPITRGQIDTIRGVSSDGAVATLRARDLIESAGHATGPGRPTLFRTTARFLEHFGLERPGQLPPLPEDIDLPPSEIQATLGLDEATIAEALRPRDPEPAEDASIEGDTEAADDTPTPEDEALDEIVQAVAASEAAGIEISSDIAVLSAAAEHAFIASRDRTEAEDDADEGPEPDDVED